MECLHKFTISTLCNKFSYIKSITFYYTNFFSISLYLISWHFLTTTECADIISTQIQAHFLPSRPCSQDVLKCDSNFGKELYNCKVRAEFSSLIHVLYMPSDARTISQESCTCFSHCTLPCRLWVRSFSGHISLIFIM